MKSHGTQHGHDKVFHIHIHSSCLSLVKEFVTDLFSWYKSSMASSYSSFNVSHDTLKVTQEVFFISHLTKSTTLFIAKEENLKIFNIVAGVLSSNKFR